MIKKKLVQKRNKIAFLLLAVLGLCSCTPSAEQIVPLPILGERDVEYSMVDGKEVADTIYHKVPEFEYINQDSTWVKSSELKNKVWIADFFFTHCPTICPPMTSQMTRLNDETQDLASKVQFLSFSIDPKRDTPTRLNQYIKMFEVKGKNWHFLTGDEEATHLLAKEFFNGAERDEEADGGFGHTDYFALVDTKGHVRGIYRGTDPAQVDSLQKDLRKLLKDEYNFTGSK